MSRLSTVTASPGLTHVSTHAFAHPVARLPTKTPGQHSGIELRAITPPSVALGGAITRIPGYARATAVHWVISRGFGHYGMTDWFHNTIYLSPGVPAPLLASVARHEYGHILEARAYHGDVARMIARLSQVFGSGGATNLDGAERGADCIAILEGATWTHYTDCAGAAWRTAAARLIAGRQI